MVYNNTCKNNSNSGIVVVMRGYVYVLSCNGENIGYLLSQNCVCWMVRRVRRALPLGVLGHIAITTQKKMGALGFYGNQR